jgi:hypothetical protein
LDYGIIVELVIPHDVVEGPVVNFINPRTDGVSYSVACAVASLLKFFVLAARIDVLLAGHCMFQNLATKRAYPVGISGTPWERRTVELEYESPIDRIALLQQR